MLTICIIDFYKIYWTSLGKFWFFLYLKHIHRAPSLQISFSLLCIVYKQKWSGYQALVRRRITMPFVWVWLKLNSKSNLWLKRSKVFNIKEVRESATYKQSIYNWLTQKTIWYKIICLLAAGGVLDLHAASVFASSVLSVYVWRKWM